MDTTKDTQSRPSSSAEICSLSNRIDLSQHLQFPLFPRASLFKINRKWSRCVFLQAPILALESSREYRISQCGPVNFIKRPVKLTAATIRLVTDASVKVIESAGTLKDTEESRAPSGAVKNYWRDDEHYGSLNARYFFSSLRFRLFSMAIAADGGGARHSFSGRAIISGPIEPSAKSAMHLAQMATDTRSSAIDRRRSTPRI